MDNSAGAPERGGNEDDPFDVVLDEDFVRAAPIKESQLRRVQLARPGAAPGPRPSRRARLRIGVALMAVSAVGLAVAGYLALGPSSARSSAPGAAAAPSRSAVPSPAASAGAAPKDRPPVPLDAVFPAEVTGASGAHYTRVGAKVLDSCTEADSVGPKLISMIKAGKGCVGEQVALYKDAHGDQYNVAVFTLRDPAELPHLITTLGTAYDDYEVGAQAPPPGSGLPTLAADSGMVQSFAGYGRVLIVGLGQWSDGRRSDYQELVTAVGPLLDGVTKRVEAYESATGGAAAA